MDWQTWAWIILLTAVAGLLAYGLVRGGSDNEDN